MTQGGVGLGAGPPVWSLSVHLLDTPTLCRFIPDHQALLSPDSAKPPFDTKHPETKSNVSEKEDVWKPVSNGGPRASCYHSLEGSLPTWNWAGTQLDFTSQMR